MELPIGKVIYDLRKKSGITQEQLADAVGVSVPAVSKWESGNSYPDITLLIPIARYLNVSVDTLLHYKADIPAEKVLEIEKQCVQEMEENGFDCGLTLCKKFLQEYPNNDYLKFRIAALLPWYVSVSSMEETRKDEILAWSKALLSKAAESDDKTIRNASLYLLACSCLQTEKLEEAKTLLEQLPKIDVNPDKLLPSVYIKQGNLQKAILLLQQNLWKEVNAAVMSLTSLAHISVQEGKLQDALTYANAQRSLISALGLEDFLAAVNCELYLSVFSKKEDVEKALSYLEQYLTVYPYDHTKLKVSDCFFFRSIKTQKNSVGPKITRDQMLQSLEELHDLDFLREDPRYLALLDRFSKQ